MANAQACTIACDCRFGVCSVEKGRGCTEDLDWAPKRPHQHGSEIGGPQHIDAKYYTPYFRDLHNGTPNFPKP